jgi:hypothetical protein
VFAFVKTCTAKVSAFETRLRSTLPVRLLVSFN